MARSTEVGSELAADHRLIELLCRQLELQSDQARRQAMADKIAAIVDWHETFDRRYLGYPESEAASSPVHVDVSDASSADPAQLEPLLARARLHILEEESHTLPEFESRVHWMVLEDLGERAREFRLACSSSR